MQEIKTVLWGFIGIRRRTDHERAPIKPVHVVVAAIVLVILFILAIRTVVHVVTS